MLNDFYYSLFSKAAKFNDCLTRLAVVFGWLFIFTTAAVNAAELTTNQPPSYQKKPILYLDNYNSQIEVGQFMRVLEDKQKSLNFNDMIEMNSSAWKPIGKAVPSMGFSNSAYWFELTINNSNLSHESLLITIANSALDEVTVFIKDKKGRTKPIVMGDRYPFNHRTIFHRHFVTFLEVDAKQQITIYMRVANLGSLQVPVFVKTVQQHDAKEQTELLGWGIYFGILIIMALYNLILYVAIKDKIYLYFSISIISNFIFQLSLYGFGFQYLWPNFESINQWVIPVTNALFYASSSAFIAEFINIKRFSIIQERLLNFSKYFALLLAMASPFLEYRFAVYVVTIFALPFSILTVVISATALVKGYRSARFFLGSWIVFTSFTFILALNKMGIIPRNSVTEFGLEFGNILSVLFISLALADRITFERQHRIAADNELLNAEKRERESREHYLQQSIDSKEQELATHREIIIAREEVLLAQAQSKNKSGFLATMSHEIRTPLNGILGMLDLLHDTSLSKQQAKYIGIIESSGRSLLNIINDVLDFSKIEAGKIEIESRVFDINRVCKEVTYNFFLLAKEKNITVKCVGFSDQPVLIKSDANRVQQVLLNLLSNSIKFTENGDIYLKFSLLKNTEELSASLAPKIKIELTDSGIGISEEQQQRLFKQFSQADGSTTREYGGTGLGLSICKRLVELMGGEIGVISKENNGATFWFTIQSELLTDESIKDYHLKLKESSAKQLVTQYKNKFHGLKVLIAEDNKVNQIVIENLVEKLGMGSKMVENGQQAFDYVKTHHTDIDLILMDCEMPELDGYDATRLIRKWEKQQGLKPLPIFALTAHFLDDHREYSANAGMDVHISKPVGLKNLYEGIASHPAIIDRMSHIS